MARAEIITHKNKKMVHIDLSKAVLADIEQAIADASPLIHGKQDKSVLCWVNTEGTSMTVEVSEKLKSFTLKNKPYIKMTAISGMAGVQKVVLSSIIMLTKRDNLVLKNTMEEALDFLAGM